MIRPIQIFQSATCDAAALNSLWAPVCQSSREIIGCTLQKLPSEIMRPKKLNLVPVFSWGNAEAATETPRSTLKPDSDTQYSLLYPFIFVRVRDDGSTDFLDRQIVMAFFVLAHELGHAVFNENVAFPSSPSLRVEDMLDSLNEFFADLMAVSMADSPSLPLRSFKESIESADQESIQYLNGVALKSVLRPKDFDPHSIFNNLRRTLGQKFRQSEHLRELINKSLSSTLLVSNKIAGSGNFISVEKTSQDILDNL